MRMLFCLAIVLGVMMPGGLRADMLDDAEAKQRGVSVERVQLEHALERIGVLEKKIAELQGKVDQAVKDRQLTHAIEDLAQRQKAIADGMAVAPATAAAGMKVSLCGVEGEARGIVYVVQTSGGMVDCMAYIQKSTRKSIEELVPSQQFGVVVFSEQATVLSKMLPATAEAKHNAAAQISEIQAQGQAAYELLQWKDAFAKAFAMKPQLIYFVTDGSMDPKLIDAVKAMDKKVKINVIGLVNADGKDAQRLADQLATIAKDHGGEFRNIPEKEIHAK